MLNDNEGGIRKLQQLKGKIHIILGNHCTPTRIELYKTLPNVVEVIYATMIKYKKQHYFLTHYPCICANYDDKPYHNHVISLSGHTHAKDKFHFEDNPFCYNVALDAHNNYPVSIEEINKDIHNKIDKLYKEKMQTENNLKDYYENGLDYFDQHPTCGLEILE